MNLLDRLNSTLDGFSYENPMRMVDEWRLFPDECGFLPSSSNLLLIAKILASNPYHPKLFVVCVGVDKVTPYNAKDGLDPHFSDGCRIDHSILVRHRDDPASLLIFINAEIQRSLDILSEYILAISL